METYTNKSLQKFRICKNPKFTVPRRRAGSDGAGGDRRPSQQLQSDEGPWVLCKGRANVRCNMRHMPGYYIASLHAPCFVFHVCLPACCIMLGRMVPAYHHDIDCCVPRSTISSDAGSGFDSRYARTPRLAKCVSHVVRAFRGAGASVWNDVAAAASFCVVWCLLSLTAMCIDVGLLQIPTPLLPASPAGRAAPARRPT